MVTPRRLPAGSDWVLFALDAQGYESLARNNAELTRWATEASWQLRTLSALRRGSEAPVQPGAPAPALR